MKVIVLGAEGQLGSEVVAVASRKHDHVMPVAHEDGDITDWAHTAELIRKAKPDVVVNCAAFHNVDACEREPQKADAVNTFAVANLALVCRKAGIRLVHLSTDYVFSGRKGQPYIETDKPSPLQVYGRTKLAGEYAVLGADPSNLVIRTAALFGVAGRSSKGGDFPSRMLDLAKTRGKLSVRSDLKMSPTYVPDLADTILTHVHDGVSGLLHLVGGEPATWFDVASAFVKAAKIPVKVRRIRTVTEGAARPPYSVMRTARVCDLPPWSSRVEGYIRLWTAKH